MINPSGSGYQIQNCTTSETYYAVLTQQVTTGSVFSSTYPYAGTCYEVLQSVEDYDNWNLVNLPVNNVYPNCIDCINAQTPTTTTTSTTSTTTTSTTTTTTTTTAAPTTTTTSTTTTTIAPASCPYSVGQLAEGGVIAYILQPGDNGYDANQQKGYVATISDISDGAEWGCSGTNITGANFVGLGTGITNTAAIVAACSTPGIAARLCSDLVEGGYSDWYLPSLEELRRLCQNRNIIGGFASGGLYWCSSQQGTTNALVQNFTACSTVTTAKTQLRRVRAIRSFTCPATTTTTTLIP